MEGHKTKVFALCRYGDESVVESFTVGIMPFLPDDMQTWLREARVGEKHDFSDKTYLTRVR